MKSILANLIFLRQPMNEFRPTVNSKDYEFDAQALYNLICHYTDGGVPLNGEVLSLMVNQNLQRKVGIVVASAEWDTEEPLFLSYDGKRTRSWSKNTGGEPQWEELNETPRRQS